MTKDTPGNEIGKAIKSFYAPKDCPHEGECIDKGTRCSTCKHNKKRSYYEPDRVPVPYYCKDPRRWIG